MWTDVPAAAREFRLSCTRNQLLLSTLEYSFAAQVGLCESEAGDSDLKVKESTRAHFTKGTLLSQHNSKNCGEVASSTIFEESVQLLQPRVTTLDAQSVANARCPGV